jgi:TetR/AcrR family transcriptional repressor of lmrAB and yxaGH operons
MFQREGYHGTSWRALVEAAGTPWGSVHHHFPGGKEELGVAAVEAGADAVAALIAHCFESTDSAPAAVRRWFGLSADLMAEGGYSSACPVASVAMETVPQSRAIGEASRGALARWEDELARELRAAGADRAEAARLAQLVIVVFEGSLVSARLHGSREPMDAAAQLAAELVAGAVD